MVVHAFLFAVALLTAYLVRLDAGVPGTGTGTWFGGSFLSWLPYFVVLKLLIFGRMRLLRGGWQYASIRDVSSILLASWLFVLITIVLSLLLVTLPIHYGRRFAFGEGKSYVDITEFFRSYSRGVLVLDFLATVFIVSAVRTPLMVLSAESSKLWLSYISRNCALLLR